MRKDDTLTQYRCRKPRALQSTGTHGRRRASGNKPSQTAISRCRSKFFPVCLATGVIFFRELLWVADVLRGVTTGRRSQPCFLSHPAFCGSVSAYSGCEGELNNMTAVLQLCA